MLGSSAGSRTRLTCCLAGGMTSLSLWRRRDHRRGRGDQISASDRKRALVPDFAGLLVAPKPAVTHHDDTADRPSFCFPIR